MTLKVTDFKNFVSDDYDVMKKALADQLQKHYDSLVETVPTIKSISWYASQEDEMTFNLMEFNLSKDNGYIYEYNVRSSYHPDVKEVEISTDEFKPEEIELIEQFRDYLDTLAHITTVLWGSRYFQLNSDPNPIPQFSAKQVKIK